MHWGYIRDVITLANFGIDRLRGFGVARGKILGFSIGFRRRPYNTLALPYVRLCDEQEGWLSPTERESVSAISLKAHFGLPGYAPGIITVNVTWMERGFNAGHSSIYPSIFNRLRAVARY